LSDFNPFYYKRAMRFLNLNKVKTICLIARKIHYFRNIPMDQVSASFKNLVAARSLAFKMFPVSHWDRFECSCLPDSLHALYCRTEWGGLQENLTSLSSSAYSFPVCGTWYGEQICTSI
jgi:hypothetical protein